MKLGMFAARRFFLFLSRGGWLYKGQIAKQKARRPDRTGLRMLGAALRMGRLHARSTATKSHAWMTLAGLEPAIFGSEDQRLIH